MHDNFGQNIVPSKQPFNQGLVLEKGLFKFVNINSTTLYEVKNTKDISQTYHFLSQLIKHEQTFLRYGLLFRSTCIKNLFLAECKCNQHRSRIGWSLVRFCCWYFCPCMSYYLLYRWCFLFSQIKAANIIFSYCHLCKLETQIGTEEVEIELTLWRDHIQGTIHISSKRL